MARTQRRMSGSWLVLCGTKTVRKASVAGATLIAARTVDANSMRIYGSFMRCLWRCFAHGVGQTTVEVMGMDESDGGIANTLLMMM